MGRGIRGTVSISGVWRLVASGLFQVTEGVHNWKSGTLLAGRSSPRSCVKRVGRWWCTALVAGWINCCFELTVLHI